MRKSNLSIIFLFIIILMSSETALAHKVTVFAWVDGDTIYTESKFNGGRKVKGGDITVFDSQGNQLLTGKTNDKGEFSFKIPKKTEMRIELAAGMGHKGHWTVPADEIEEVSSESSDNVKQTTVSEPVPQRKTAAPAPVKAEISSEEIQVMMEKALDKKLKPVIKMLADSQEKGPSINDIFGGIGYILGLMGIAMYFKTQQIKGKE